MAYARRRLGWCTHTVGLRSKERANPKLNLLSANRQENLRKKIDTDNAILRTQTIRSSKSGRVPSRRPMINGKIGKT